MDFSDNIANVKPSLIREIFKVLGDPSIISLSGGNPDAFTFPSKELSEISQQIFEKDARKALQYGITEGYVPLREQITQRLRTHFNTDVENNTTLIVTGGQQGIDLTTKIFVNRGDTVLCEEPSFIGALNCFRTYGAKIRGVKMDADGINIEALEQALKDETRAKLLYTIPTYHNPMGVTMSMEKREKVYSLAKKYDIIILEDNPYGEICLEGEKLPTIKSLDTDERVVYVGSFSKIISPGMRLGFVSAPNKIAAKLTVAKQVTDVHTNLFFQMLVSGYLEKYNLDDHIEYIKSVYRPKRDAIVNALDKYIPKEKFWRSSPNGGIFIWCQFYGRDCMELTKQLLDKKVAVVPGVAFLPDENAKCDCVRLNYSMPSIEQIEKAISIIGETVNG